MLTPEERDWYDKENRFLAALDARSFQWVVKETGRREGLQEGLQRMLQELVAQIRWCQRLLKQSQTPAEELLKLSEEELRRSKESLEQQVTEWFPTNGNAG